jgi:hypothetical protein
VLVHGEMLGTLVMLALTGILILLIQQTRLSPAIKSLLIAGLLLRIFGAQVYYQLTEWFYGGSGDYNTYFQDGGRWADALLGGTLDSFHSPYVQDDWCCTAFTIRLTGLLLIVLGATIHGAFIAFALFGFAGLIALAVAFHRAYPDVPVERYLRWVVFFPSLWYWPAALGKDALMLGGLGLAVLGFVGRNGRTGWVPLCLGTALVFAVRPQVAVVVGLSMGVAHWLAGDAKWTVSRISQGVALAVGGVVLMVLASGTLGMQLFSIQEVEAYLDTRSSASAYGGSAVETGGVVGGLVNVLFRPFLWEVRSMTSAIAALEVSALWGLAFWKRADIKAFFVAHRTNRLLWFSILFMVIYVVMTGIALGNLGLIARQRIHVFPFFLMFFAGRPLVRRWNGSLAPPVRSAHPRPASV